MHGDVQVLYSELFACSPDVAVMVPKPHNIPVHLSYQYIRADIELPFLVEKRFYVFLNYPSPFAESFVLGLFGEAVRVYYFVSFVD